MLTLVIPLLGSISEDTSGLL